MGDADGSQPWPLDGVDEAEFRRLLEGRYANYVVAWRTLLDPDGYGYASQGTFRRVCEELGFAGDADEAFDELAQPGTDLMLADLDPAAARLLRELASAVRSVPGGARAALFGAGASPTSDGGPLMDLQSFIRACLVMGIGAHKFSQMFACLDYRGSGFVSLQEVLFLDYWESEPVWEQRQLHEELACALDRRSPLAEICDLASARGAGPEQTLRPCDERAVVQWNGGDLVEALCEAAERGHHEHVEHLLACRADPRPFNQRGMTALHCAAIRPYGRVDPSRLIQLLFTARADVNAHKVDDQTPLLAACMAGRKHSVAALCRLKADVRAQTRTTGSCLLVTVTRGDLDCCKLLLAAMADPCVVDKDDTTALLYALERGKHEVSALLQRHVRRHYVPLLGAALTGFYTSRQEPRLVLQELQKMMVNYLHLAKVPANYLAQTINCWREVVPGARPCRWPKATAAKLEHWPGLV